MVPYGALRSRARGVVEPSISWATRWCLGAPPIAGNPVLEPKTRGHYAGPFGHHGHHFCPLQPTYEPGFGRSTSNQDTLSSPLRRVPQRLANVSTRLRPQPPFSSGGLGRAPPTDPSDTSTRRSFRSDLDHQVNNGRARSAHGARCWTQVRSSAGELFPKSPPGYLSRRTKLRRERILERARWLPGSVAAAFLPRCSRSASSRFVPRFVRTANQVPSLARR